MSIAQWIIVSVVIGCIPCQAGETVLPSSELLSHPSDHDDDVIDISGYLKRDGDVPRFYVSREAAAHTDLKSSIDVYSDDKTIDASPAYPEITCVVIEGRFRAYDAKRAFIGFGNFVSPVGVIDVVRFRPCSASEAGFD